MPVFNGATTFSRMTKSKIPLQISTYQNDTKKNYNEQSDNHQNDNVHSEIHCNNNQQNDSYWYGNRYNDTRYNDIHQWQTLPEHIILF